MGVLVVGVLVIGALQLLGPIYILTVFWLDFVFRVSAVFIMLGSKSYV